MAGNRLSAEVKAFIVRRLACFDTPSNVAEAVSRQFGETITRQRIECYDPHKRVGARLSPKWRRLFETTRNAFLEETSSIGISHRAVRLRKLDQQVALAEEQRNAAMIARLLRLAQMEMRPYTKRGELGGTGGRPVGLQPQPDDETLARAILVNLAKGMKAPQSGKVERTAE